MVIRELLIRLGLTGGAQAGRELDKVDNKVHQVTGSFRALGGVLTGVLAGLSLKSIIHIADEMQTLQFRVGQMSTTVGDQAKAFDEVVKHATASRVSVESYVEAYAGIGAATHDLITSQDDLLNVTDSIAQGLQLAGANAQQTNSVMMQLMQSIAVGKLQWGDMRIMMQNSDAFVARIAKSMGMSLNEMVNATQGKGGGISAKKLVDALRSMGEEVKREFSTMPLTVTQGLQIISNRWDLFINRMNRSSGAVTRIANTFLWMADKGEYALDIVTEALGGAENAVKLLGIALGAAGLLAAVWALPAAFAALTSPVTLIIAALVLLYAVGEDVYRWLNKQSSLLEDAIGPVDEYRKEIDSLSQSMTDLRDIALFAYNMLVKLRDFMNTFQDSAQELGDKIGTTSFGPWVKEKLGWLASDLGQWGEWFNSKTYGAFDISQMWGDSLRGVREFNASQNITPPYSNVGAPSTYGGNTVSVSIGTIEVPAGTSKEQVDYLNRTATETFDRAGYDYARQLSDDMSFNRGVSK